MNNNFSERLNKLFSSDLSDEDILDLYIDSIDKFYDELKNKYNLPKRRENLINRMRLINKDDLPEDSKTCVAGTYSNDDETYSPVICPENTREAYNKDKQYYDGIENFIIVSAIHELAHIITFYLNKCDSKLTHNEFWKSIYEPYKKKYCRKDVLIDKVKDIADFSKTRKIDYSRSKFTPRVPSYLIPGSDNFDKELFNRMVRIGHMKGPEIE